MLLFYSILNIYKFHTHKTNIHCVKCVQIRSFFWSVFSRIRTEYGEIRSISPYSVRMRENTHQKKLRIWTLFSSDSQISRYALIVLVPAAWQYDTNSYKILDKKIKKMRKCNCLQVNIILGLTLIILRKENL